MRRVRVIGLTGGIGSGKSTVAKILASLGAAVIDADRVGHDVYAPGTPGWLEVKRRFGDDVIAADGQVDRRRLGAIVFADPSALSDLNSIVHPRIGAEIARRVQAHRTANPATVLVIEAALLVEAGWLGLVDAVWVVRSTDHTVVERLETARGITPEQTRARMAAQVSNAERVAAADVVIDNDGTLAQLESEVRSAWERTVAP